MSRNSETGGGGGKVNGCAANVLKVGGLWSERRIMMCELRVEVTETISYLYTAGLR